MIRRYAITVLLLFVSFAAVAGMNRTNPLDSKQILWWHAGTPEGAEYGWQPQFKMGDGDWTFFVLSDVEWGPTDCLAYEKGLNILWRGCYVGPDGKVLKLVGTNIDACNEAGEIPLTEPCSRILSLSGDPFTAEHVARWNAEQDQP